MMRFLKAKRLVVLVLFVTVISIFSCEEDFTTIGTDIIGSDNFNTESADFDVFASTRRLTSVQSNGLSVFQLGVLNNPVFGRTQASITTQLRVTQQNNRVFFGVNTQEVEDEGATDDVASTIQENETVERVFLNLPFFVVNRSLNDRDFDGVVDGLDADPDDPNSDSDGDGVTDFEENANGTDPLNSDTDGDGIGDAADPDTARNIFPLQFELDSIFGNRNATFDLRVDQSTFFLRNLDPDTNFQEAQGFFSGMDFTPFRGTNLFEGTIGISNQETLIFGDPDPDSPDQTPVVETRIPPGIRVELNADFFQENFVDMEGTPQISNNNNLAEFIRGLIITTSNHSDDLLMVLNLAQASIDIEYTFERVNQNGTLEDPSDDFIETQEDTFNINFPNNTGGIAVNTFQTDPLPAEILSEIERGTDASRLYLNGGAGTYIEIDLFDPEGESTVLEEVRANNWLINEANLEFFVDRDALDLAGGVIEPARIYLYNITNNTVLVDYFGDPTQSINPATSRTNYDGFIQRNSEGNGTRYRIRLTQHINNILRNDSTNVKLGLAVTANINNPLNVTAIDPDQNEVQIPQASVPNPFGTIIFGSNTAPEEEDRRLRLTIFFTEPENN